MIESEIRNTNKKSPRINKTAIQDEMDRLNKMYLKGRIKEDEYDIRYEELEEKLKFKEEPQKDYTQLKEILNSDFKTLYSTFSRTEKQILWRSIIDSVKLHGDDITINFL